MNSPRRCPICHQDNLDPNITDNELLEKLQQAIEKILNNHD